MWVLYLQQSHYERGILSRVGKLLSTTYLGPFFFLMRKNNFLQYRRTRGEEKIKEPHCLCLWLPTHWRIESQNARGPVIPDIINKRRASLLANLLASLSANLLPWERKTLSHNKGMRIKFFFLSLLLPLSSTTSLLYKGASIVLHHKVQNPPHPIQWLHL